MCQHFLMFAAYNAWANQRLYDAAATLTDGEYRRDVGAFFRSMHGTLNHVLVADRIWIKRFTGTGEAPVTLDAILYEDLGELRIAREAEDRRIADYIDGLDETALAGTFTFTTIANPMTMTAGLGATLSHFFNHQTHHRGQAHTILSILEREPPSLDLVQFHRSPEGKQYA